VKASLAVLAVILTTAVFASAAGPSSYESFDTVASSGDPGPVHASRAAWPGPDGFGYNGTLCNYSWIDISSTGTLVSLSDDNFSAALPIGFTFSFYGTSYTEFYIGSNGFLSFGSGSSVRENQCTLPSDTAPNNQIALMWDDLDPGDNSDPAYYETFATGSCPWTGYGGACLVVELLGYSHYNSAGAVDDSAGTFEAILFDDGVVVIQFQDVGTEAGLESTTGIEGADAASGYGLTYACNTASSLAADLCLQMEQAPFIALDPSPVAIGGCSGTPVVQPMQLANASGADGTFALTYSTTSGNGSIVGQDQISVLDGAAGDFDVTITSNPGLPSGTELTGTVGANGNTLSALADVTFTATDPVSGWLGFADTPQGSRFHAVAYVDGKLYQIGGETNWWTATGTTNVYDTATDSWTVGPTMPTPVYGADAAAIGSTIYVPGGTDCTDDPHDGCTAGSYYDTLQTLDTTTGTWGAVATDPMPAALAYASAVAAGGKLYVVGGFDSTGTPQAAMYVYDPAAAAGSRWTTATAMPTARAYSAAGVIGDNIYVAGGWAGGTTSVYTLEIYSISGGAWSAGPGMNSVMGDTTPYVGVAPFGDGTLDDRYLLAYGMGSAEFDGTDMTYSCGFYVQAYDTVAGAWLDLLESPRCLYGVQGDGPASTHYAVSGRTNEGGWQMSLQNQLTGLCGAAPVPLFADNFESGDMTAWSTWVP